MCAIRESVFPPPRIARLLILHTHVFCSLTIFDSHPLLFSLIIPSERMKIVNHRKMKVGIKSCINLRVLELSRTKNNIFFGGIRCLLALALRNRLAGLVDDSSDVRRKI